MFTHDELKIIEKIIEEKMTSFIASSSEEMNTVYQLYQKIKNIQELLIIQNEACKEYDKRINESNMRLKKESDRQEYKEFLEMKEKFDEYSDEELEELK